MKELVNTDVSFIFCKKTYWQLFFPPPHDYRPFSPRRFFKWREKKVQTINETFFRWKMLKITYSLLSNATVWVGRIHMYFHTSFVIINWTHTEIYLRNAFADTLHSVEHKTKHRYMETQLKSCSITEIVCTPLNEQTNESEEFSLYKTIALWKSDKK